MRGMQAASQLCICSDGVRARRAGWPRGCHSAIRGHGPGTRACQPIGATLPPAVCRVWDIRTKVQIHCLSGHEDTVASILAMPTDPQVGARHAWVWDACLRCGQGVLGSAARVMPSQPRRPVQVITASHDKTIRLWDLRMGKTLSTLTYHKKVCVCARGWREGG